MTIVLIDICAWINIFRLWHVLVEGHCGGCTEFDWTTNGGKATRRVISHCKASGCQQLSRSSSESLVYFSSSPSTTTAAMFRKSVSKAVPSRALLRPQRAFSTSLPVRRVVASNPVKAEEVKVYLPAPMSFFLLF
jgi:hypothetical protein